MRGKLHRQGQNVLVDNARKERAAADNVVGERQDQQSLGPEKEIHVYIVA